MADKIEFDQGELAAAIGKMAEAHAKLNNKFQEILQVESELSAAWKTPEGEKVVAQFANIKDGVEGFNSTYSSLASFLSDSVSVNYAAIEEEIAARLSAAAASGGDS